MISRFFRLIPKLPTITTVRSRRQKLLKAMRKVESGGEKTPWAVGDSGRSLGPYQITYGYWLDAVRHTPALKEGTWPMVVDRRYAEAIMHSYWKKYAPLNATWEQLARIHNGGPKGHGRPETAKYWRKVCTYL